MHKKTVFAVMAVMLACAASVAAQEGIRPNDAGPPPETSWPVPGYTNVSSDVGPRTNPVTGQQEQHKGTDIPAPVGTPVVAVMDGTVAVVTTTQSGGGTVVTDNVDGSQTTYMHITPAVSPGQEVESGTTVIGTVAAPKTENGGYNTTGPHVHVGHRSGGSYQSVTKFK